MTNFERRKKAIEEMVNKTVIVTRLGEFRPEDQGGNYLYVPLPEYGVVLWLNRLTSKDSMV